MKTLNSNSLLEVNTQINRMMLKVLNEYLCIQPEEKLVVLSEYPSSEDVKYKPIDVIESMLQRILLLKHFTEVVKQNFPKNPIEFLVFTSKWELYPRLDEHIKNKVYQSDVVFASTEFSSLWLDINIQTAKEHNFRAALAPHLTPDMFLINGPIDIDVDKLEKEVIKVYTKLKKAKEITIYNDLGTRIVMGKERKYYFETGKIDYPGKISNIPSGEITIMTNTINGTYVTPPGWIEGINNEVKIIVENGITVEIQTDQENAKKIYYYLNGKPPFVTNMVVIGLNPKARNPFSKIELEKMRGVANLVFQPKSYQQKNIFGVEVFTGHFPSPKICVEADDEVIIKNGRVLV